MCTVNRTLPPLHITIMHYDGALRVPSFAHCHNGYTTFFFYVSKHLISVIFAIFYGIYMVNVINLLDMPEPRL